MSEYDENQIMRETARAEERESKQAERADIAEHELAALRAENARLRAANRWIPVTERYPEVGESVLVWYEEDGCYGCEMAVTGGKFELRLNEYVTHWRPLPEPPAGETE